MASLKTLPDYPVPVTEALLQEITKKIVEQFHPEKVIIFGSHAWGMAHPHSDVDLLVIMENDEDTAECEARISMACRPRFLPMDILVRTPEQIEERLRIGDFFIIHGIVIITDDVGAYGHTPLPNTSL